MGLRCFGWLATFLALLLPNPAAAIECAGFGCYLSAPVSLPDELPTEGVVPLSMTVVGNTPPADDVSVDLTDSILTVQVEDAAGTAQKGTVRVINGQSAVWVPTTPLADGVEYFAKVSCSIAGGHESRADVHFSAISKPVSAPPIPTVTAHAFYTDVPDGELTCCKLPNCYRTYNEACDWVTICEHCDYPETRAIPRLQLELDSQTDELDSSQIAYLVEYKGAELTRIHSPTGAPPAGWVQLETDEPGPWCVNVVAERIATGQRATPVEVCAGDGMTRPQNESSFLPKCDIIPVDAVVVESEPDSAFGCAANPSTHLPTALLGLYLLLVLRRPTS